MNNISNIPNEKLVKDRVNYMNKNMKAYLDTYFPDKRQKIQKKSLHSFSLLYIILIIIILVTILSIIFHY
jgi:cell division protein FtsL